MPVTHTARERREVAVTGDRGGRYEQEVVAERVGLDQGDYTGAPTHPEDPTKKKTS
jgi:hypothetical protein